MIPVLPRLLSVLVLVAGAGRAETIPVQPSKVAGQSSLVGQGPDGRLRMAPYTAQGDVLPDFSFCGFGGGGVALPAAVVRETLQPEPGNTDDGPRIQAALDRVARLPLGADGMRGAVLLRRGAYRCAAVLKIVASGVALRGESDGEDGTVITATTRKQQVLVRIAGRGPRDEAGSAVEITDAYVPVGARSFSVGSAGRLKIGQTVGVVRRGNAAWITAIAMDRIKPRDAAPASTKQWTPFDLRFDRVITALAGDRVTVDAPLACAIETRWGGGALVIADDTGRIEHCGVEALRAVAAFDPSKTADYRGERVAVDEDHATHLVEFDSVKNAWARRLKTVAFYHGVATVERGAKAVTVEDCNALDPVSVITGGRRYPFNVNGQLVLVQRCYARRARHAFVFGSRVAGPNVFLDCRSELDYATSEPHHRWSVGGLYDNVEAQLAIQDRQWMGSGHGWAGANYVVWNSRGSLVCQQPPTAQNFAIGFVGKRGEDAFPRPPGWWESEGTPVEPRSLYRAQLAARAGRAVH